MVIVAKYSIVMVTSTFLSLFFMFDKVGFCREYFVTVLTGEFSMSSSVKIKPAD